MPFKVGGPVNMPHLVYASYLPPHTFSFSLTLTPTLKVLELPLMQKETTVHRKTNFTRAFGE